MEILQYKEFEGSAELDMARNVCRGKILHIDDLVTYESDSIASLQAEFEAAVDDYLETCKEIGKSPQKPYKGQFNVRVPAVLHRSAARLAVQQGTSLNEVVVQALDHFVNSSMGVSEDLHGAKALRMNVSVAKVMEIQEAIALQMNVSAAQVSHGKVHRYDLGSDASTETGVGSIWPMNFYPPSIEMDIAESKNDRH